MSSNGDVPSRVVTSGDEDGIKRFCTQLLRKEIIKSPSIFTCEDDIQIHISKIDEYIRVTNINDDKDKVCILTESLQEELKKELKMRNEYHLNQDDYESMKDFVVKVFKKKSAPITPFLKLLQTRQIKNPISFGFCSGNTRAGI